MSAPSPRPVRGVALVVALLVVALATILIAALLDRGELAFARTRNALRAEQAQAYALGLEAWSFKTLLAAQATPEGGIDSRSSLWAQPLPPQTVPGGSVGGTLRDLHGCFNLNNLARDAPDHADWKRMFVALVQNRGLDAGIADAVQGWIDGDDASASAYAAQNPPYRPRGDVFAHASELRLVRGVDARAYARLAPHVCALPMGTAINLNTADRAVLWSLSGLGLAVTEADAVRLWSNGAARHASLDGFARMLGPAAVALRPSMFGITSRYFVARAEIMLDDVPFVFESLLDRRSQRVLARSRGAEAGWSSGDAVVAGATR